jgi:hypothetical protein
MELENMDLIQPSGWGIIVDKSEATKIVQYRDAYLNHSTNQFVKNEEYKIIERKSE